jgi:hypothetical protein
MYLPYIYEEIVPKKVSVLRTLGRHFDLFGSNHLVKKNIYSDVIVKISTNQSLCYKSRGFYDKPSMTKSNEMAFQYKVGDLVLYKSNLSVVTNINFTNLGFNMYQIADVVSGEQWQVAKHHIEAFVGEDCETEVDWDVPLVVDVPDCDVSNKSASVNIAPSASGGRHVLLTDAEIDDVARQRLSVHTENQTKWAVNLFKG